MDGQSTSIVFANDRPKPQMNAKFEEKLFLLSWVIVLWKTHTHRKTANKMRYKTGFDMFGIVLILETMSQRLCRGIPYFSLDMSNT